MDSVKELLAMKLPVASKWSWMPFAASTQSTDVDWLFNFLLWTGIGLFLLVMVPAAWFVLRYRRKTKDQRRWA
jgi:heme/copper-type cytochrome/quinol oxidase subunit 2